MVLEEYLKGESVAWFTLAAFLATDTRLTDADLDALARDGHGERETQDAVIAARWVRGLPFLGPVEGLELADESSQEALGLVARLRSVNQLHPWVLDAAEQLSVEDLRALADHFRESDSQVAATCIVAAGRRAARSATAAERPPSVIQPNELESFGANDAVVQFLGDDVMLVVGNTDLAERLGDKLQTLSPNTAHRFIDGLGPLLIGGSATTQAAASAKALKEGAVLYKVAKESLPALQKYGAVMSDGKMLGVLKADGGRGFAHMLRFESAGSANLLRTAGAMSNVIFTASVVAGQLHMQRTLQSICAAVDELKARDREEQVAAVTVAQRKVMGVLQTALEVGELTPALMAQLPDIQRLEEQVERASLELARHRRTLSDLPNKAKERLTLLEQTVDDLLLALGLYREAERSLSVTLALAHHQSNEAGDRAADALQRLEERHRQQRLDTMTGLARDLEKIMDGLEADPGSAWIRQGRKEKVRKIARQVGADLTALADLKPATTTASAPRQLDATGE